MPKQILIYEKLNDVKTLERGRGEDGFMRLKGVFGECSKQKNRNGRIYVAENYKQMVDRIKARILEEGVPGQLEHPQTMNIDYNEVSHVIEDINIDEKGLVTGTVKLLDTPKGKIAQALVEGGLPLFISSRATGQVDKNGVVTLENIQTYDLVGTPGFANARLNLAESLTKESGNEFITESFDDNLFIVESKENAAPTDPANKENEFNMTEQEHKELLDKIDLLEQSVKKTNERVDEVNSPERMRLLAEGIQNWIINEYSPSLQNWVVNEAVNEIVESTRTEIIKQVAEGTQNWILKEFAPNVNDWIVEHFGNELKGDMIKQIAEGVQNWMVEQYAPQVQNWIAEEYSKTVETWIDEHFRTDIMSKVEEKFNAVRENRETKLASIDSILEMLDKNPAKPIVDRVNENVNPNDPLYIREMPAKVRPLWESADDNMKEYIQRKARLYDLRTNEAVENFWENIDWNKKAPVMPVYEGLENIQDSFERDLRARLRRHSNQ